MTLALDFPTRSHSLLGRLDSRWKLAAMMLAAFAVSALQTLPPASGAWVVALILVLNARDSLMRWL